MQLWMITALLAPSVVGVALQRTLRFDFRSDPMGYIGRTLPFGFLALAITLFLLMAVGVPVNNLIVPYIILAASIGLLVWSWLKIASPTPVSPGHKGWASGAILLIAVLGIVDNTTTHLRTPVYTDDDASIWTLKAKVLHGAGSFHEDLGEELRTTPSLHHQDYPILNPLIQVWVLANSQGEAGGFLRVPTMLWALSLLLLIFSACRRLTSPTIAALLALLVVSAGTFQQATTGTKSDVIVIVGLMGFIDFALRCLRDPSVRNIGAMGIFGAILVWSKNEGLMLILTASCGLAALKLWSRAFLHRRAALLLLIPVFVVVGQISFNSHFDLRNDILTGGEGKDARPLHRILIENTPEKVPTIASTFLEIATGLRVGDDRARPPVDHMAVVLHSNGIFLIALAMMILFPLRILRGEARAALLCTLLSIGGFGMVYIISFEPLLWHLYTSAPRVLFHLCGPIAIIVAALSGQLHDSAFPVTSNTPCPLNEKATEKTNP